MWIKRCVALPLATFLFLLPMTAGGQEPSQACPGGWNRLSPPSIQVSIDSRDGGVFYALAGNRFFKSVDCGRSWEKPVPIAEGEHELQGIDMTGDALGTLYAVTSFHGIWLSKDGGKTWTNIPRRGMTAQVEASPAQPNTLYATWLHQNGKGRFWLERSDDGGRSWRLVGINQQSSFALDPFDVDTVYGVTHTVEGGQAVTGSGILQVSHDGGLTWQTLGGLPELPAVTYKSIAVGPDRAIWVTARDDRIYVTRDQGITFQTLVPPFEVPFNNLTLRGLGFRPYTVLFDNGANPPDRQTWTFRPPDFGLQTGHFYTQASGQPPETGLGYAVSNEGGIPFWEEFQRLGGVPALGYPVSKRFTYKGFITQAYQKGVMQWQPGAESRVEGRESSSAGQVFFVNVFDELHQAGKDDLILVARATPRPLDPSFDAGKAWEEIVRDRLALLEANPDIRERYFSAPDPLLFYGLPTSRVEDMGNHYAIRLQRAVIQQWKEDMPWAKAGEVTVANGGDIAKEAGIFPAEAMVPETPP